MTYDLDAVNDAATPEVVAGLLRLEGRGSMWRCPLHDDRTPSLSLRRQTGRLLWHCFGCSAGGNAVQLVAKVQGLTLPEAARFLADRLGLVPESSGLHRPTSPSRPARAEWPPPYISAEPALVEYARSIWESCRPLDAAGRVWLAARGIGQWAEAILRTATDRTAALADVYIAGWVAVPWIEPEPAGRVVGVRFRGAFAPGGKKLSPCRPEGVRTLVPCPGLLRRPEAEPTGETWLTEGESDALVLLDASAGATVWMLPSASGWRAEWCRLLPPSGRVVVALDADEAGEAGAEGIIRDLARWQRMTDSALTVLRPELRPQEDLADAIGRLRAAAAALEREPGEEG